jgi:hypothetical protein
MSWVLAFPLRLYLCGFEQILPELRFLICKTGIISEWPRSERLHVKGLELPVQMPLLMLVLVADLWITPGIHKVMHPQGH